MNQRTFLAEWILPVTGEPIHDGYIRVQEDRIVELGQARSLQDRSNTTDLEHTVLFPALVNTLFHPDIPDAGDLQEFRGNFLGWLHASRQQTRDTSATDVESRVLSSIKRCYDHGTAAIGIRTTHPRISEHLEHSGIYSAIFQIMRGFRSYDAESIWKQRYTGHNSDLAAFYQAPEYYFNLSPEVIRLISRSSARTAVPMAFLKAEEQFYSSGKGQIHQFLLSQGDMDYRWKPPGCSSIEYFTSNAFAGEENILSQMILVTEEELDLLSQQPERMHICLHPRFDRAWELGTAPAKLIRSKGFNLCLGTFAEHLDMRREMRSASAEYGFTPAEILRMATLNGALALGFEQHIGSLESGKDARIYGVQAKESIADPYEFLLLSTARMQALG